MDPFLPKLVDDLLDSYAECGGINHINGINLPSKGAIATITHDLLSLLFPGFHADHVLKREELPEFATALLSSIQQRLHIEIAKKSGISACFRKNSGTNLTKLLTLSH